MATDHPDQPGHDGHTHDADVHAGPDDEVVDERLQSEFDELLNVGIDVAQQLLEEQGAFLPFAVALTAEGETQVMMLEDDEDIDGEEALEALVEELTENRDGLVGIAVVSDVLLDDDQDAIRVDIEHSDLATEAMVMALEYSPVDDSSPSGAESAEDDTPYSYGELLGSVGERRIWA
ncbi:hypothetical protein [Nocardioides ferulae]|uniref:hypothetical protein n=1 Tax=Nocardioides ferulae TaxID=2340821 RepID=UPI000EB08871|nr:hypothetical protein [Nocardioides ferulae]